MWIMVMFDLPVVEPEERKIAAAFRNSLLDMGFSMAQFSIYMRLVNGYDAASVVEKKVQALVPANGKVTILTITDKQYERMKVFHGRCPQSQQKPDQLALF